MVDIVIDRLNKKNRKLKENIESLTEKCEKIKSEKISLNTENISLKGELQSLQEYIHANKNSFDNIKTIQVDLESFCAELSSRTNHPMPEIVTLEKIKIRKKMNQETNLYYIYLMLLKHIFVHCYIY